MNILDFLLLWLKWFGFEIFFIYFVEEGLRQDLLLLRFINLRRLFIIISLDLGQNL